MFKEVAGRPAPKTTDDVMDLAGKYVVVWLSSQAMETFLGVLEPSQEHAMTTSTVAGQIVGEAGPGLWV